jgi:hypothetical protein
VWAFRGSGTLHNEVRNRPFYAVNCRGIAIFTSKWCETGRRFGVSARAHPRLYTLTQLLPVPVGSVSDNFKTVTGNEGGPTDSVFGTKWTDGSRDRQLTGCQAPNIEGGQTLSGHDALIGGVWPYWWFSTTAVDRLRP